MAPKAIINFTHSTLNYVLLKFILTKQFVVISLRNVTLHTLFLADFNYLGPPITLTQAANIGMKRGISPGWDGVPLNFCTTFRNLRGQFILNMIKCPIEKGWFLKWYLALLSVLPKPSKDHILCSNYRPLSILTTVKAFACILASFLEPYMTKLVHCGSH